MNLLNIINKINPYKIKIIIVIILILISYVGYLTVSLNVEKNRNILLTNKYEIMNSNFKQSEDNSRTLVLTIDQLNKSNDSVILSLDSVRNVLKIKNNKITSLQWYKDNFSKRDTIKFKDTIFVKDFEKDTIIGNKHYKLELNLRYPSTISTNIEIYNEKSIISHLVKETVEPKKNWPWYWFQKKQIIEKIEVSDSNPYITNKDKKIIKIIDPKTFKEKK